MKLVLPALALVFGSSVIAGCASPGQPQNDASADKAPKVYRTGSNIPVRDVSPPMTDAEREQMRQDIAAQSAVPGQRGAGGK